MNYHYYIGKGPESNALVAEVLEKNTTVTAARVALRDEYGADALILGGWDNDRIAGLGFKEKQSIPFLKECCLSKFQKTPVALLLVLTPCQSCPHGYVK